MKRIGVIGSGLVAQTLAKGLARHGYEVKIGSRSPDKLAIVRARQEEGERVVMVGDGTNDAPALSAADVGVALAAHGGGVSAEAAGLVLLQDDLARLPLAIRLSRRTLGVARQSIGVGLGLSSLGMVAAALGYLTPVAGAITQEVIDVARRGDGWSEMKGEV